MIYVFEGGSIVYDGNTITAEQKAKAVAVESLPTPEVIEGKIAILKANKAEERVYYEYVDMPVSNQDKRIAELEGAVMELTVALASIMGGAN